MTRSERGRRRKDGMRMQCVRDVNETHRELIQTPIPSPLHLNPHRPEIHRMRYGVAIARDEIGVDGFKEEGV